MKRARIKTKREIESICLDRDVNGYHLRGQFFCNDSFELSNKVIDVVSIWSNKIVCDCLIDGEYRFFSVDALDFNVSEDFENGEGLNLFNYDKI